MDKNADTGQFELAFKQPQVHVPPYIGMNLTVDGSQIKKPGWMNRKTTESNSTARLSRVFSKTDTGMGTVKLTTAQAPKNEDKKEGNKENTPTVASKSTVHAKDDSNEVTKSQPSLVLTHKKDNSPSNTTDASQLTGTRPSKTIKNNFPVPSRRGTRSPNRHQSGDNKRTQLVKDLGKNIDQQKLRKPQRRIYKSASAKSRDATTSTTAEPIETIASGSAKSVTDQQSNWTRPTSFISEDLHRLGSEQCNATVNDTHHVTGSVSADPALTSTVDRPKGNLQPQPVKVFPFLSKSSLMNNMSHSVPSLSSATNQRTLTTNYNSSGSRLPSTNKLTVKTPPRKTSQVRPYKVPSFAQVGVQLPPALPRSLVNVTPRSQPMKAHLLYKLGSLKASSYKSDSSYRPKIKIRYNHGLNSDEMRQIDEQVQKINNIITSSTSIK